MSKHICFEERSNPDRYRMSHEEGKKTSLILFKYLINLNVKCNALFLTAVTCFFKRFLSL